MTQTRFSITVEIPAPAEVVWRVMADVERWPEWTASVRRVRLFTPGSLAIGSRARIHQPGLPPARWRVTELEAGKGFTWISSAPGLRVTAKHDIEPANAGSCVTLSIRYAGVFGPLMARWAHNLNDRYLAMESNGLKARCVSLAGVGA